MIKVQSTTDYSKFCYIRGNRSTIRRVNKMVRVMKKKNQLANHPILVTPHDGKLGIADGQARFEAAKVLRVPIFYIIGEKVTIEDISAANSAQSPWKPGDYVHSFAEQNKKDYMKLKAFIHEFHLPVTTSAMLLGGSSEAGSPDSIRQGRFKVNNETIAYKVADIIVTLKKMVPFATEGRLSIAMMHLCNIKGFSPDRLIHKIETQRSRLVKCATMMQYVELLEGIYNYNCRREQIVSLKIEVQKRVKRSQFKPTTE